MRGGPAARRGRRADIAASHLAEVAEVVVDSAGRLAEEEQRVEGAEGGCGLPREAARRALPPRRLRHACALGRLLEAGVVEGRRRRRSIFLPPLLPAPSAAVWGAEIKRGRSGESRPEQLPHMVGATAWCGQGGYAGAPMRGRYARAWHGSQKRQTLVRSSRRSCGASAQESEILQANRPGVRQTREIEAMHETETRARSERGTTSFTVRTLRVSPRPPWSRRGRRRTASTPAAPTTAPPPAAADAAATPGP